MSEPTTLRESLEAALGPTNKEEQQPEVAQPAPAPELEAAAAPEGDPQGQEPGPGSPDEPAADLNALAEVESQPRDEKGKFKSSESGIVPGPKAGPKADKAPASWRPDVRNHWQQLPELVRAEVARREAEVQRTLQETAEARKYVDQVQRTFAPYEAYIRAENANPLQVIDNLMSTAVRLRTGTGPELASLMANMVKQFGTGRFGGEFIHMLDSALAGVAPQQDNSNLQIQQVIQQQLAPVQQFMTQIQQAQVAAQQRVAQQATSEVEQFIAKSEFGNDVREEMADLMELAAKRGRELSLQDAYDQACQLNPSVRTAIAGRQRMSAAQGQNNAVQKARAAAVSVPSTGPSIGAPTQQPDSIRSAIEASIAAQSR